MTQRCDSKFISSRELEREELREGLIIPSMAEDTSLKKQNNE